MLYLQIGCISVFMYVYASIWIHVFQEYEETCLFTKHESLQGDSPRVHPNILKCFLHSLVTKGIRLVGFATRAMVCESPTHYLILNSLAFVRGRVILRSHFLILLLLIILLSHYILTSTVILLLCDHRVRIFQQCFVDADRYIRILDFRCLVLPTLKWPPSICPRSPPK